MKKLFVCVMASLCSTFAFAQTDGIVMEDVNLTPDGTETLYVKFKNPTNYTAFQFDLTLPKGVSVEEVGIGGNVPSTRKIEKGLIDAGTNKYRFLSYDMENAKFSDNTSLKITLKASEGAAAGEAETSEALVVTPTGESAVPEIASANIKIQGTTSITIPAGEKLAMVSEKDLDFTSLEAKGVKAYVCTGYEIASKKLWMTRVKVVPANTPILVKGAAGDYNVQEGTASIYYPQNFLFGSASADATVDKTAGYINYGVSQSTGSIGPLPESVATFGKGKAYFHVPSSVASKASSDKVHFEMGKGGKLAMVSDYDLDFTEVEKEGLKAYTVTGFDNKKIIWLTRVMAASAGTPLLLRGTSEGKYDVASAATQMAYVNMLDGNTSETEKTLTPEMDGSTIYVLSLGSGLFGPLGKEAKMAKGKAWLPVPTSFLSTIAASRGESEVTLEEPEVICLVIDSNTTAIDKIAVDQAEADVWYNLNGQRINTPTKKGLYIKNGVKVIVK